MSSNRTRLALLAAVVATSFVGSSFAQENASTTRPTAQSASAKKPTILLCHGAFAGGWEWKACGEALEADGYKVYRPTYTGQGERVHLATPDVSLNTHIDDVVNLILFEDLHDIVIVGHSYGGMVITGVIDRVPDRIAHAIYLDAGLPVNGETGADAVNRPDMKPAEDGFFHMGGPNNNPNRKPPYTVDMPGKTFTTPIVLKNQEKAKAIPTDYILTVDPGKKPEDDMFWKPYQRAQSYGWRVSQMSGDHVVHINQTAETARRIEAAINTPFEKK